VRVLTIAVTGGIGSGKSTVSGLLGELGAVIVDSDRLAREIVAVGTPGLASIAAEFGPTVLAADGSLDRQALAALVFGDAERRARLEGITHPLVRARYARVLTEAPATAVVVNDIPILRDLAVAATFHLVIGVRADVEERVRRLKIRGLAESDARARIAAQIGDAERDALCDALLDNSGPVSDLAPAVHDLWHGRVVPFADNILAGVRASRGGPRLAPPDPSWPLAAARVAARASRAAGGLPVEHIGSTAIPGMAAKDVLDLQLGVDDLEQADALAEPLRLAGFPRLPVDAWDNPHPAGDDLAGWRKRLHANADPAQSVNLHVRVRDSPGWRWALLFRDWMRASPAGRAEYDALKRALADRYAGDPDANRYAEAKEGFMVEAFERSTAWAARAGWAPNSTSPQVGDAGEGSNDGTVGGSA
jgi:dephospho-CoA kinase